jgi:hypothetical protein
LIHFRQNSFIQENQKNPNQKIKNIPVFVKIKKNRVQNFFHIFIFFIQY